MADLTSLREAVQAQKQVTQGVITLLTDIHSRLEEALADDDPEAMAAVLSDIKANTQALAEAVAANTPGGPPVQPLQDPVPPEGSSS